MTLQQFEDSFSIQLPNSWRPLFMQELQKPYFIELLGKVEQAYCTTTIYPARDKLWQAFLSTPLDKIQGVLLGQDPYHKPNQACGLAFSIPQGQKLTPSLRNVFKELARTHGKPIPSHGCLQHWAEQGMFLLNTILTVQAGCPLSHAKLGWTLWSDAVIAYINMHCDGIFFFLWGKEAQKKAILIDQQKHEVICAAHPSPLARGGFVGSGCFQKADAYCIHKFKKPICW